VAVTEEITSPELVLVSPPEVAAQARDALPDYKVEYADSDVHARATAAAEATTAGPEEQAEPEKVEHKPEVAPVESWPWYALERKALDEPSEGRQRLNIKAFTFSFFASLFCLAPLLLLLYHRRLHPLDRDKTGSPARPR
jgi:hypothetical protein